MVARLRFAKIGPSQGLKNYQATSRVRSCYEGASPLSVGQRLLARKLRHVTCSLQSAKASAHRVHAGVALTGSEY